MLCEKKRSVHAEGNERDDGELINFAWIVVIGMKIGYAEREVAHMYFGKWCDLFEEYKKLHNFEVSRTLFKAAEKERSLMEL